MYLYTVCLVLDEQWIYRYKDNLMKFLELYHTDKILQPFKYYGYQNHRGEKTTAIMGAFEIVKSMKAQEWGVVEKVLDVYLHEVAKKRAGWTWK